MLFVIDEHVGDKVVEKNGASVTVLIKGLNKDVFSQFIYHAQRNPFGSYDELVQAVKKEAAHEDTMEKLDTLRTGQTASTMVTTAAIQETALEKRMVRLEHMIVNLHSNSKKLQPADGRTSKKSNKACWSFTKRGTCNKGDACNFLHEAVTPNAEETLSAP